MAGLFIKKHGVYDQASKNLIKVERLKHLAKTLKN